MSRFQSYAMLLITFLLLSPPTSAKYLDYDREQVGTLLEKFNYTSQYKLTSMNVEEQTELYTIYKGNLATNIFKGRPQYRIPFMYYKNVQPLAPLIVVFPAIEGVTVVETGVASYFAKRGYHAIIVESPEDIADTTRPTADFDNFFIRVVNSSRLILDYLKTKPEVDYERIGGFGASLGGIRCAYVMVVDDRIKAGYLVAAAGNLAEVVSTSKQRIVKNYRNTRMRIEGIATQEAFKAHLLKISVLDPMIFAHRRKTSEFFMGISIRDKSVPTKNQLELWNSLRRPDFKNIYLPHVLAVTYSLKLRNKMLVFFSERL
ncbi:MAG: acetylxylan esterase [Bacteriovoracaceae bacterium]|nr:acetylxylan esterase [Bacteriovoracaceae bacterium]